MLKIALLFVSIAVASGAPTRSLNQKLVVILLDGFRWDYVERENAQALPGFRRLHREGVRARWVEPIFPSVSYPSWTTLSTGVYAENHNIIGNYFYDSSQQEAFELFNTTASSNAKWWQHAEPIWATATQHGRKVGTFLWARSDVPIKGVLPHSPLGFVKTAGAEILGTNLQRTVSMLEDGYDMVMLYNEHLDNKGHDYGPNSPELKKALGEVDVQLYNFLQKLTERNLDDTVNVMIVSDHGMAETGLGSGVTYVKIEDYLDLNDVSLIVGGSFSAVAQVSPHPGKTDEVYQQLKQMPGVDVYLRDDIPVAFNLKRGRYLQEILLVAKSGFIIRGSEDSKYLPADFLDHISSGSHGFDGEKNSDMRTIFMAKGPAFIKQYIGEPIALVDIYQMYAHILQIPAQPNNGTWSRVRSFLTDGICSLGEVGW